MLHQRRDSELVAVVVEMPQTVTRGKKGKRSAAHLPTYGMAVGMVLAAARTAGVRRITPSATEWTRGLPGVDGDEYKTKRVRAVTYYYGAGWDKLLSRKQAGNVADAALLARWALHQIRREPT